MNAVTGEPESAAELGRVETTAEPGLAGGTSRGWPGLTRTLRAIRGWRPSGTGWRGRCGIPGCSWP